MNIIPVVIFVGMAFLVAVITLPPQASVGVALLGMGVGGYFLRYLVEKLKELG